MNTKVKSKKNYDSNARELVWKLQKADQDLRLFFNILSDVKKIKLSGIHDKLKFLYPINKASLKSLNHMLAKFKIQIINDATKKAMSKNPMIQSNDIYLPEGYRANSKPITIYNRRHLPMVINHGN